MSREAIDPIRERIDAAWLRSDADGITSGLAEDAVLMPPNAPKQVGRQQINGWLRELFRHYAMTELVMPERELTVSGDIAVERSTYQWTLTPLDAGEPIHDKANWVGIWRKDPSGTWAEICGIWNSSLPAGGAQAGQRAEEGASVGR
jgi:uncharacterized protein (TIGR02246 family)